MFGFIVLLIALYVFVLFAGQSLFEIMKEKRIKSIKEDEK